MDMPHTNGTHHAPLTFAAATWLASKTPDWLLYYAAKVSGGLHYCLATEKRKSYLDNTRYAPFTEEQRPWHAFQNQTLNVFELLKSMRTPDAHLGESVKSPRISRVLLMVLTFLV